MTLALSIFGIVAIAELLLWVPLVWRYRSVYASLVGCAVVAVSGSLIVADFTIVSGTLVFIAIYRLINLARIVHGRTHASHLYYASRRTGLCLFAAQAVVVALAVINDSYLHASFGWLYVLAGLQIATAAILLASTIRHIKTTTPPVLASIADRDLPSLTVAIPARNETELMEACLATLTMSNYPKLEILVLDDCSQERRTPEIIRKFAQDGVRFIGGEVPPDSWLAKNFAYKQLADAANGELLLFCGVDVRFEPDTLRALVEAKLAKKKTMLSVIPKNQLPPTLDIESLMVQPGRYAWELALPRRLFNRPPILSTCWLIERSALKAAGGFEAISRSVGVESYFAKYAIDHHDGYSFIRAESALPLKSAKQLPEQRATAVRTRYPQLHRRPELVALLTVLEVSSLITPFLMLAAALIVGSWLFFASSLVVVILLICMYALIVRLTYRHFLWRSLVLMPFAAFYDVTLLNYSMWLYEFREVIWKGRNICLPVMHVTDHLPKI
jgi:glycosyltransferase involved in cell wall biosynthesis